jgi:hypothetical protein
LTNSDRAVDAILSAYDELMAAADDDNPGNEPMHVLAWCLATIAKRHCSAQLGAPCTCQAWLDELRETIECHRPFAPEPPLANKLQK